MGSALGAGLVIFEIQQNSDTTYRVFDWNRVGLDGRSRTLHIAESLASIDFNDFEPSLVQAPATEKGGAVIRPLIENAVFRVWHCRLREGASLKLNSAKMEIIGVVSGVACVSGGQTKITVKAGEFTLLPACLEQSEVGPSEHSTAFGSTFGS